MIRVLIVDDSRAVRQMLRSMLEAEPDIEVVGEAVNGRQAVEMVRQLQPGLVTMDLEMPLMNGLQAIEAIMCSKAVPILVVSTVANARNACEALRLGALDVISKPTLAEAAAFIFKVRLLADMVVITRRRAISSQAAALVYANGESASSAGWPQVSGGSAWQPGRRVFAIASSTGGPQALTRILPRLPADFSGIVLIAQHLTDGFAPGMAEWISGQCVLPVRIPMEGELVVAGTIYLSPSEQHLTLAPSGHARMRERLPGDVYHPSCDALLSSVAASCGETAVGLILTGMGGDGVIGLANIRNAGGVTLAQDEATSVIYGMNRVAVEAGVIDRVLPLEQIAATMLRLAVAELSWPLS